MKNIAYFAFALLGLIWGTNFMFMKWALEWISPAQIVLVRAFFGFLPILIYALATRALSWSHVRHLHHFLVMALLATAVYYYLYAEDAARGGRWTGDVQMCVAENEFKITGVNDCYARGYQKMGFKEYDTGRQGSWMVQLSDTPGTQESPN